MRKTMTLVELLVVVVLLGILATTVFANYSGTTRAALRAKAQHALSLIAQAERMVRSETGAWVDTTIVALGAASGMDFTTVTSDVDWVYTLAGGSTIATATRAGAATTVTYDFENNVWAGTF